MHKILITGGAGYIGSHTAKIAVQSGYNVHVVDNLSTGKNTSLLHVTYHISDISDYHSMKKLLLDEKPEIVIHFAASAYVGESVADPIKYYENNVHGTMQLLRAMNDTAVKKIVFSSSCATYGEIVCQSLDEEHPQNPINPYGRTKLICEQMIYDYAQAYGLKAICLRYFNAAGCALDGTIGEDHDPETHLIPLIIKAMIAQKNGDTDSFFTIFGNDYETDDGSCIRDFVHVEDLASAHILSCKKLDSLREGEVKPINIGSGVGTSVFEVINACEDLFKQKLITRVSARRPGDPAILVASNLRARDFLNWNPKFSDIQTVVSSATAWFMKKNNI